MNKKNQKGFTLVELIVVIAIVAILASVAIVGYTQFINNARQTKAQAELDQIYNVMYADAVVGLLELNAEGEDVSKDGVTGDVVVSLLVDGGKLHVNYDDAEGAAGALKLRYMDDFDGTLTLDVNTLKYKKEAEVEKTIKTDSLPETDGQP